LENNKSNFLEYLNFSGISELYKLEDLESKVNFLRAVRDSIILRDIVKRHNIKDVDLLEKLFLFLSGNI
jgi:predicted AAA+ superfamily ATPase